VDDLEFRRQCYTDPYSDDAAFIEKCHNSKEAADLAAEMQAFDKQLEAALNVPVPEQYTDKILSGIHSENITVLAPKKRYHPALALAASIVLGFFIFFQFTVSHYELDDIKQEVFAHAGHEAMHVSHEAGQPLKIAGVQRVSYEKINQAFGLFNAKLNTDIGDVYYVNNCVIAGKKGVHLVIAGKTGMITVLYIPHVDIEDKDILSNSLLAGHIFPAKKGTMAIVGEDTEQLEAVKTRLMDSISWSA